MANFHFPNVKQKKEIGGFEKKRRADAIFLAIIFA